jgi:hypothetical protein
MTVVKIGRAPSVEVMGSDAEPDLQLPTRTLEYTPIYSFRPPSLHTTAASSDTISLIIHSNLIFFHFPHSPKLTPDTRRVRVRSNTHSRRPRTTRSGPGRTPRTPGTSRPSRSRSSAPPPGGRSQRSRTPSGSRARATSPPRPRPRLAMKKRRRRRGDAGAAVCPRALTKQNK